MALGSRQRNEKGPPIRPGRVARALALALLVLLAPVGSVGDLASADDRTLSVADGSFPQSDVPATGTIEQLHAAGVTGDNVTVGVLDVTGFDTATPPLAGQVAATRSFGAGGGVPKIGRNVYGTASAAIVASVAPDAELYLASFTTQDGYTEAVEWFISNDVDVLVVPVSFYGQPRDGDASVANPVRRAARGGMTVVAAAGNLGNRHWRGTYAPDGRGRLQFDGSARNHLSGNDSRVVIWLSWSEPTDDAFTVELYRDGDHEPVATSTNYTFDTARNERLVATIDPNEDHYFVVRGTPFATRSLLTVESPTHDLEFAYRHGSVTQPAVSDDIIAVGAYDLALGGTASYSSAGPVDRNPGVDVLGPTNLVAPGYPKGFQGTSASTAYVGGLAVLVHDVAPDTTPGHVESLLERTARDVNRPGPDTVSGYGVTDPTRLIELAKNESNPREIAADGNYKQF